MTDPTTIIARAALDPGEFDTLPTLHQLALMSDARQRIAALADAGLVIVPAGRIEKLIEEAFREGAAAGHCGQWTVRSQIDVAWAKSEARKNDVTAKAMIGAAE